MGRVIGSGYLPASNQGEESDVDEEAQWFVKFFG
jgi:hypothetical protein